MDAKLKRVLDEANRQKTFITFVGRLLNNHSILKKHYVLKGHDDKFGNFYDFDFMKELSGPLRLKFDLLRHILDLDECDEVERILKKLNWFFVGKGGFDLAQLIHEATYSDMPKRHDLEKFREFDYDDWQRFLCYFL